MISALFFFNYKGDVLISRIYRANDVGYVTVNMGQGVNVWMKLGELLA